MSPRLLVAAFAVAVSLASGCGGTACENVEASYRRALEKGELCLNPSDVARIQALVDETERCEQQHDELWNETEKKALRTTSDILHRCVDRIESCTAPAGRDTFLGALDSCVAQAY